MEYIEVSREEYIQYKAESENLSYEEAEKLLDIQIWNTMISHGLVTCSPLSTGFEETDYTYEDRVRTSYGYFYSQQPVPNSGGYMSVKMSVFAVTVSAYGGRYIAHVSGNVILQAGSNGGYTVSGGGDVVWDDHTVRLSCTGNAEIALSIAHSVNLDAQVIQYGQTYGTTEYLRFPFTLGDTIYF